MAAPAITRAAIEGAVLRTDGHHLVAVFFGLRFARGLLKFAGLVKD